MKKENILRVHTTIRREHTNSTRITLDGTCHGTKKEGKKANKFSTTTNPVMKWFRAKILPLMIKLGSGQIAEVYNYKTGWVKK